MDHKTTYASLARKNHPSSQLTPPRTMQRFLTQIFAALLLYSTAAFAADGPLPFAVTVGDQAAAHKTGQAFAQLDQPVAADAAISVETKADLTIINVHKAGADGQPDSASQPAIILLQGTSKGTLAQTMDKQKLAAGKYFLSITSGEQTASIKFEIK